MSIFKKLFGGFGSSKEESPPPDFNLSGILDRISDKEATNVIEPGRKIHSFHYDLLEIRTDRDITGHYRVTVWQGKERLYSFTVFAKQGEYDKLERA
ncbi:MAG TPA: hypothetical protein DEG32_00410, partial [Balneolaceae bacterium]|nr:hypothetical protein [Balneolaceae bacterium]